MLQVILSLAACAVLTVATAVFAWKRQPPREEGELLRMKAVPENGLMAGMLLAAGFALDSVKLAVPDTAGTDNPSYTFIAIFALLCAAAGCHIFLTSFVKQVVAYDDRFVVYTPFGASMSIRWQEVTEVKTQLLSKAAAFKSLSGNASVNGRNQEYLEFLKLAMERVPRAVGSDELGRLYQRCSGGR